MMQPTMLFVPPKSPEQQNIQALHRARQSIVNHRTATLCQIRGLLLDRGITIGAAVSRVRRAVPLILEDAENGLSVRMRRTIAELYDLFNDLKRRIHFFDKEIETVFRQSEACQRIAKVKGIGPQTATVVVAELRKHSVALIMMEATGGLEAAVACSLQAEGFDVAVVNPRQAETLPVQWDTW